MRSTHALKATGLVLIAVVLGLLTVQGSYALLNKTVSVDAGTIQSANFRVSLTDTNPNSHTDMTVDGKAGELALSTTPLGVVIPGQSAFAGVQLGNVTDAGGDFTIQANTGTPVIGNTAGSPLAKHLSIKVATATSLAQCSQAELYAAGDISPTAVIPSIPKDDTGVFCFQVSLAADMPASLSGQSVKISIPLSVNQLTEGTP